MSRDFNQCTFVGRLGGDPETRHMSNGKAVANFSIACGEKWKDKNSGEDKQHTEWIRIVAFDKLGEICGEYLRKGGQVLIQGKFTTRKWQDKEGKDQYTTEIIADKMQMLGSKPDGGRENNNTTAPQQRPAQRQQQQKQPDDGQFDDDIPF